MSNILQTLQTTSANQNLSAELNSDNNYLYGELNQQVEETTYTGKNTDTINVTVNNQDKTISANLTDDITTAILSDLNVTDTSVTHQFVDSVSQSYGKIHVTRKAPAINDVNGLSESLAQLNSDIEAEEAARIAAIEALDSTATIATMNSNERVILKAGLVETNGIIDNSSDGNIVLAKVAHSGTAADVAVVDTAGKFRGTNAETVLAELYDSIEQGGKDSKVTIVKTASETTGPVTYQILQGTPGVLINTVTVPADRKIKSVAEVTSDGNETGHFIKFTIEPSNSDSTYADEFIYCNISAIYNTISNVDTTLATNLSSEVTRATNKETELQTNVTNEQTRAEAAESRISTSLTSEISRATAAENTLTNNLSTEVTNRTNADTALGQRIDDLDLETVTATQGKIINTISQTNGQVAVTTRDLVKEDIPTIEQSQVNNLPTRLTADETDIDTIESKIPSAASSSNQLADKEFVNSSITHMAANYVTYNIGGDAFPTRAALLGATTFYHGGAEYTPTNNDYAVVVADEAHLNPDTGLPQQTRYVYVQAQGASTGQWDFQYVINGSSFTAVQWAAINSGATSELITNTTSHLSNTSNPHGVTKAQVGLGNVDNKSEATIKTDFTGAIAASNTGFVTGDELNTKFNTKADKVTNATSGNFAGLDSNGNLTDSGSKASDFDTAGSANTVQNNLTTHINNKSNPHEVTKTHVGLGNVDNTSDANKPVSTAQQTALDLKMNTSDYDPTIGGVTTPVKAAGGIHAYVNTLIMEGASASAAGTQGLVPVPAAGDQNKYLQGNGTWTNVDALPSQSGQSGKYLTTDGSSASWSTLTLPDDFTGATSTTTGVHGLVPAPSAGDNGKFLKGDGTWSAMVATNTARVSLSIVTGTLQYTVSHGLNTRDVIVQIYDDTTYETIMADVTRTTVNAVTIDFSSLPTHNCVVLFTAMSLSSVPSGEEVSY